MHTGCALSIFVRLHFQIPLDELWHKLREEIVHNVVQGNVITIVLFSHDLSHLVYFPELIRIVELEVESRHPTNSSQSNGVVAGCFRVFIDKHFFLGVERESSGSVAEKRSQISDSLALPELKAFDQLLTGGDNIIINGEEYLCWAVLREQISIVHWIVGSFDKINWPLPPLLRPHSSLFRHLLIVPHDVDLGEHRTLHCCISVQVALYQWIVLWPWVRHC